MKDLEELREELAEKQARLSVLENNENTDEYDDALNESGPVTVCGSTFDPAQIIKEMDPTAYRCGMNDYNDSAITEINDEIETLESDIKEAELEEKAEAEEVNSDHHGDGPDGCSYCRAITTEKAALLKAEGK